MNITEFKAKLQFGGARPNLYRVLMSFPTFAGGQQETEEMSFLCKAAQIPAGTVGTIEIPFLGRILKVGGDRTFEEWTLTILNDNDFVIRNAFERWMDAINGHDSNVGLVRPQDYMTDAIVQQLNRNHEVVKEYNFVDLFPSNIDAIDLGFENTDVVEEFAVTVQYQYWTANTTT